jgi:glycosyltransferase involved in cell wall biosynthesis
MKIMIVHWLYEPYFLGGGETVVQAVAEGLGAAGHQPFVVALSPHNGVTESRVNDIKVYYVGLANVYWPLNSFALKPVLWPLWHAIDFYNVFMARRVGRIIDRELPTLVHTNGIEGFSPAVWREVASRGVPCVHSMHSYQLMCPRATMFRRGRNCRHWCFDCRIFSASRRRMAAGLNAAIGDSRFLLNRHVDLGFFRNTPIRRVVHYGCTRTIDRSPRRPYSEPMLRIGYLGRLHPTKGVEVVLQAATSLPPSRCEIRLAGVGVEPYERQLKESFRASNVKFLGFAEPHNFLREIDVLVVPSLWQEPFGLVIPEAYAHGVPVIGSRRGGIPELIEDGETGFLFDPSLPASLSELLNRFVHDPNLLIGMRLGALRKAREFLIERMVQDYVAVYNEVLEVHRPYDSKTHLASLSDLSANRA